VQQLPKCLRFLRSSGYDFINSAEATAAEVMSAAGYNSIHYGKW
jgi:arylsulfatase A-like enzyme